MITAMLPPKAESPINVTLRSSGVSPVRGAPGVPNLVVCFRKFLAENVA